jgi:hypothetical protein
VAAETTTMATAIAFSRTPGRDPVNVPLSCNLEPLGIAIHSVGNVRDCLSRNHLSRSLSFVGVRFLLPLQFYIWTTLSSNPSLLS